MSTAYYDSSSGDATASNTDNSGNNVAGAIAQIFSTGVTAYVDSQAIQAQQRINNPQYFAGGYPGGVANPYGATPAGAGIAAPGFLGGVSGGISPLVLLIGLGVVAFLILRK